jgi:hypothetical protein
VWFASDPVSNDGSDILALLDRPSVFFCLRSTLRIGAEISAGESTAVATWYKSG